MNQNIIKEDSKFKSLNEYQKNIEQLLTECRQNVTQLPQSIKTVRVKLKSYMPDTFSSHGFHIRPVFYLNKLDQPVQFNHTIEQTPLIVSDGSVLHEISCKVDLPILLDNDLRVFYFYQLESYENDQYSYKTEHFLTENKLIRYIKTNSYLIRKNNSRDLIIPNDTVEEIDGILLFEKINNLDQIRMSLIEVSFPVQFLNDNNIHNNHEQFKKNLSYFPWCYQSFLKLDKEYGNIIKTFLNKQFGNFVDNVSQITEAKSNSTYLSILAVFYLSRKFELNQNLDALFQQHNVNDSNYFNKLKDFFRVDDNSINFEDELNNYLNDKKNLTDFNALIVLYYLRDNKKMLLSIRMDNILTLAKKINVSNAIETIGEYANYYQKLIKNDMVLGALFIYFLNPDLVTLKELTMSGLFPIESLVYHLGYKLVSTDQDEFEKYFLDKSLNIHIDLLSGFFQYLDLNQEILNIKTIKKNLMILINIMINSFSKESDSILSLIQIVIKLNCLAMVFSIEEQQNTMHELESLVRKWFSFEFDQSILINFGLKKIPLEDIESNKALIDIYRNFAQYQLNFNNRSIKKFENVQQVRQKIRYFGMSNEHEILSNLKNTGVMDQILLKLFREQIKYSQINDCIIFLINFNFDQYLNNEFRQICLETISDYLIQSQSEQSIKNVCELLKSPQNQIYLDFVLDRFIDKVWPKSNELKFCTEKPFFVALVTIFVNHSKENFSNPFNQVHIFNHFNGLINSYKALVNKFCNATISLEDISLINWHNNNIVTNLNNLIIENFGQEFCLNARNKIFFSRLSQIRSQERKLFHEYRQYVSKFIQFCSKICLFKPKITDLLIKQNTLDQLSDSEIYLNNVCSSIDIDQFSLNQNFTPSVSYFVVIDSSFMREIERILNHGQVHYLLFDHFFDQSSRDLKVYELDLAMSTRETSNLTFKKLNELIKSIGKGDIKLTELDLMLSSIFKSNMNKFYIEFKYWIDYFRLENSSFRIKQIELYLEFTNNIFVANEINEIRKILKLTDEFRELERILSISTKTYQESILNHLDKDVEKTISYLSKINKPEQIECLKAFTQSLDLASWLRKNTKDLEELKFFVGLASMSVSNDTVYNQVLFARALKDSGTAYASLIYKLKVDANFETFMLLCQNVCDFLNSDPKIAAKLLEVKDKINLLEQIKEKVGNVELNSIKQAKIINEKGIFRIGTTQSLFKDKFLASFHKKLDLNEIVSLELDGQHFSYCHLKKLQDILMLIVPKNSELIQDDEKLRLNYFFQFLDLLNQLAQSYLNFGEYSCRFFENFQIKIYSNSAKISNLPSIQIDSELGKVSFTHPESDSLQTLTILSNWINKTEQEWTNFVSDKLDSYPLLNYFNLKQISFISKSIELIVNNLQLAKSDFEIVQNLLWNINKNLSEEKILYAYTETMKDKPRPECIVINECVDLDNLFTQQWKAFLAKQNSVNTQYITLTHFALILNNLYENKTEIRRKLPGLKTNEPNLISCSNNELMCAILSIYALTPDQPMPTNNEIMFCQSNTTSEQIENFIRLCFNSSDGMIFTLVNIHNLSYNVSNKAELFLRNYLKKPQNFNLILTCDNKKETDSILASVYLKNRVQYLLLEQETLKIYIKRYLTRVDNELLKQGNFDPNNCTVRMVMSDKSGNGKSTYVKHLIDRVKYFSNFNLKIIRIKSKEINIDNEIEKIIEFKKILDQNNQLDQITIYHIDIASEVFINVEPYLFSLILSSYMMHSNGLVWRRNSINDYFLIETSAPMYRNGKCVYSMIDLLPKIILPTPSQYIYQLQNEEDLSPHLHRPDRLFRILHKNVEFQRVSFYLKLLNEYRLRTENLNAKFISNSYVTDEEAEANVKILFNQQINSNFTEIDCLEILLKAFEPIKPNWLELRNYVNFLNSQLILYEKSHILDSVKGFRALCLGLMVIVASNFGLPSLQSFEMDGTDIKLDFYTLSEKRKWENLIHPYMILDSSSEKITFIGTHLDRSTKQFLNPNNNKPLGETTDYFIPAISHSMFIELLKLRLRLFNNFNEDHRISKLRVLSDIMNLNHNELLQNDPDKNYQLALDNCLKMIAIYLRFVCKIPVVLMGETGCGKTSLIQFFSKLIRTDKNENLIHMKIHGGTTRDEIEKCVTKAEQISHKNYLNLSEKTLQSSHFITCILFLDEANTTEEIGLIKELMCDGTINGRQIDFDHGLKIIAAVNPYRKHSDMMIQKLESAGLGFYVSSSDTRDRFGHIPMRQLVYRVQPLPTSLQPLVWDFGQLEQSVEKVYISQMISEIYHDLKEEQNNQNLDLMVNLIQNSHKFMRESEDECSFVSIRNIERIVKITKWLYSLNNIIFPQMNKKSSSFEQNLPPLIRSFILSLMICYHSALYNNETRKKYRHLIMETYGETVSYDWVFNEIFICQSVFFDEIVFSQKNIARNSALFENVFMMIVCIELRIPLFIVGKPGSSKSLAKSIVSRAMEGRNSKSLLFQKLKETFFINFQCSPLTTSEMILETFREAAKFQETADTSKSVAVVNLDEIGLAEGSESMPLKVLHPLLESGVEMDNGQLQQVAVIGISNWALDPAKMNRGLFVSRGDPDINELILTARGICAYDKTVLDTIEDYLENLAKAYLDVCQMAREFKREFYGLRDYYSLIKMVFYFCSKEKNLTWSKLEHAVRRNFDGLEIDFMAPFKHYFYPILAEKNSPTDPKCDSLSLVESALKEKYLDSNSRYLLFLSENSSAIDIVLQLGQNCGICTQNISIVFSSSFRFDQQYTEICRNISLIKHSMEIGKTVVLLNAYNLYESLYDALNQYYYEFAGQKYVDLGLGTHRIKCLVHENFRLIIIAEREVVYDSKKFPIPLINRLEKHFLNAYTILNDYQKNIVKKVNKWIELSKLEIVGLHSDAVPSIVLNLSANKSLDEEMIIRTAEQIILQCATPESIICQKDNNLHDLYFNFQKHFSLKELLNYHLTKAKGNSTLVQISSICKSTIINLNSNQLKQDLNVSIVDLCLLQSFDTQHQFVSRLKKFYSATESSGVLLIQADLNLSSWDLVSCARYFITEAYKSVQLERNLHVIFLVLMEKGNTNFSAFQHGWSCYHLDEIEEPGEHLPDLELFKKFTLSQILQQNLNSENANEIMEVDGSRNFSISALLKKLSHKACSLIKDTNITRTICRIDLFNKLCDQKAFVHILTKRLINLQKDKEHNYMVNSSSSLLANICHNMRENLTLRRSCEKFLINKLSPLLAFIISQIDLYSNMDVLIEDNNWRADLWLNIFDNNSVLKIQYSDMRCEETGERKMFDCNSDFFKKNIFDSPENLRPSLPFFWLLISQFNLIYSDLTHSQIKMMPFFFSLNPLFQMIDNLPTKYNSEILDYYVRDLLLINCEIRTHECLEILTKFIQQSVSGSDKLDVKLAMVHCFFHSVQSRCHTFCKFANLQPGIEKHIANVNNLEIEACKLSISKFKNNFRIQMDYFDKAYEISQLVEQMLRSNMNDEIFEQYEALCALRYFVDMVRKFLFDFEHLKDQNLSQFNQLIENFNHLSIDFNNEYFRENVSFKSQETIQQIHKFIIKCDTILTNKSTSIDLKDYLSSFYLDIVDNICFDSSFGKLPNTNCIECILNVVTSGKIDSLFEIDFLHRTLIIQIIFKSHEEIVQNHLIKWFHGESFIGNDLFATAEEVSILFLDCVLDRLIGACIDISNEQQFAMADKICCDLLAAEKLLERTISQKKIRYKSYEIESLILISKYKFVVNIFTKYIYCEKVYEQVKQLESFKNFNQNLKKLIDITIFKLNTKTFINFMIKDLIRKFGSVSVKYVMKNKDINWVTPEDLVGSNDSVIDKYVLLDEPYVLTKKAILDCFLTRSIESLEKLVNEKKTSEPYLCLALYQNVTILTKNMPDSMPNLTSIFESWLKLTYPNDMKTFTPFIDNSFANLFKVNEKNWRDIDLTMILLQLKYSIIYSKSSILKPLREILTQPDKIQDCYLPTMPQDNLYDIKIAMQSRSSTNKFYSCPNGHIYVIGDCGRPWIMDKCKTCGEVIGGEQHKLVKDNSMVDDAIHDKTMKGYCIQEMCNRAENIRSLNMVGFFYERFLIDACMYLAMGDYGQNKKQVMGGMCHEETDLDDFFLIRIKHDLTLLSAELNFNIDEIFLLIHLSLKQFLENSLDTTEYSFKSKLKRQEWEENFYQIFFHNIQKNLNNLLSESNSKIRNINQEFTKEENSQSTLYFMAYELISIDPSKGIHLYENESFWKYRPKVSFDLISKQFISNEQNKRNYPILSKFIEINSQMELLVNLSHIMQMVNLFKIEYNKKIYKYEARTKSIEEFILTKNLPKDWSLEKIKLCVDAYQNTWVFLQPIIGEYALQKFPKQNLSVTFRHNFSLKTELSYFLPTQNGDGFLSYLIIHYLAKIQNDMLEHSKKKLSQVITRPAHLFESQSQIISFNKNSDLLRILQSNFSYNSQELKLVFRYEKIENQILDRYLRSKAQIDFNSIPIFEYSDEITYFTTFKRLNEQVRQESLNLDDQAKIMDQFKTISELSEALNTLRLIIDYVIVSSLDSNDNLENFIQKIYSPPYRNQAETILKTKIMKCGKVKHLKLIWILLITKQSILSTNDGKDPFEALNDIYKKEIALRLDLNLERSKLVSITVVLYQVMELILSTKKGDDIESYSMIKITDLFDSLEFLEQIIILDDYIFPDELLNYIRDQEIKMEFIYSIWKQVCLQWK